MLLNLFNRDKTLTTNHYNVLKKIGNTKNRKVEFQDQISYIGVDGIKVELQATNKTPLKIQQVLDSGTYKKLTSQS